MKLAKVRYWPTRKVHAVRGANPAYKEGSLTGFTTYCGISIYGDTSKSEGPWMEEPPENSVSCLTCLRFSAREEP